MAATVSKYPALMLFSRKRLSPTSCYICVCAALLVYTSVVFWLFAPAEYDMGIDFWEHVAAVKQLMIDPIHPLHPQYSTHDPSRQYMPWYLLLANLGRVLSLDPLSVMAIGAILTTLLWVVAIHLFFREYFESRWAPLVALTCLFFMWGIPWVWSGVYNFRWYLTTAADPSGFVFGLTLV